MPKRGLMLLLPMIACDAPSAQTCNVAPGDQAVAVRGTRDSWSHEPAGFRTVSKSLDAGWRCEGDGVTVDSGALVFTYPQGFPSGYAPGVAYFDLPTPAAETYFGFWWKPSDQWESHQSGVNKMALLFPATSSGGTVYIMMFFDGKKYTIQVETTFSSDTRRLEPNLTATPVELGKWHQIEWYVRYSSNPTSRDGLVRWWLDGVAQGEYSNLQMPPDAGFIEYTIRPVWGGGTGDVKQRTDFYSYGPVHISTP